MFIVLTPALLNSLTPQLILSKHETLNFPNHEPRVPSHGYLNTVAGSILIARRIASIEPSSAMRSVNPA